MVEQCTPLHIHVSLRVPQPSQTDGRGEQIFLMVRPPGPDEHGGLRGSGAGQHAAGGNGGDDTAEHFMCGAVEYVGGESLGGRGGKVGE